SEGVQPGAEDHVLLDTLLDRLLDDVFRQPGADTHPTREAEKRFGAELCTKPPGDSRTVVTGKLHRERVVEHPGWRLFAMQRPPDGGQDRGATGPARGDGQRTEMLVTVKRWRSQDWASPSPRVGSVAEIFLGPVVRDLLGTDRGRRTQARLRPVVRDLLGTGGRRGHRDARAVAGGQRRDHRRRAHCDYRAGHEGQQSADGGGSERNPTADESVDVLHLIRPPG